MTAGRKKRAAKKRAPKKRRKPNPSILVVGANPGGEGQKPTRGGRIFGKEVDEVFYVHVTEGPRRHPFGKGVKVEALPDGSIRLFHPRKRLWKDM